MYCMLKFLDSLWIIIAELFKLPLVFDPIGEVIYHLPICDIKDLGPYFSKVMIILLEGFIWFLFASSKLVLGTWVGEDATNFHRICAEAVPKYRWSELVVYQVPWHSIECHGKI